VNTLIENLLNKIDPSSLRKYFESDKALKGRQADLARTIQGSSTLEKIARNLVIEYKSLADNSPMKSSILRVASEVLLEYLELL